MIKFDIPPDLESLVEKRIRSGAFSSVEEVFRRALQAQDDDESWTPEEKDELDAKIERSLQQLAEGGGYEPDQARHKLAEMRAAYLGQQVDPVRQR